jgi:hypothetical protein
MELDFSRLRGADRLVAAAALALALFVFVFEWFGESLSGSLQGYDAAGGFGSLTGWQVFTNSRWVWLATVLVALASVPIRAGAVRLPGSLPAGSVVALLGTASVVLIAYRIVHHPAASAGFAGFRISLGIKAGIWLGLAAAVGIACGGWLQLRDETATPQPAKPAAKNAFTGLTVAAGRAVSEHGSPPSAPSHAPRAGAPGDTPGDGPGDAP